MEYFQKFLEELEQAPPHLQQEFKIIRELDQKVYEISKEAELKIDDLLRVSKSLSKQEKIDRVREIQGLYQAAEEISTDKVSRAESIYELVDRHIQRLDADMGDFKRASTFKGHKRRRKKFNYRASTNSIPSTTAFAMTLTNDPKYVLDMPVDPNEPTYCICNSVSYGAMIACDNMNCPYEWFHFECVGITTKPEGKWYCPHCRESKI